MEVRRDVSVIVAVDAVFLPEGDEQFFGVKVMTGGIFV